MDRPDPAGDQVEIAEVTHANCAIETFADNVDETVTIARMHMKALMSPCELSRTGAKCVGPKDSGAAIRNLPRRSPAGKIVSLARSISAHTRTACSRNVSPLR